MTRLATIFVVTASLVACTDDSTDDRDIIQTTTDWHADITGSVAGTSDIVLASDGQSFAATIAIAGGTPGSIHPWHVHFGTCGATGAIVGATVYPELTVGGDGSATANVTVDAPLAVATPYAVNVHLSPDAIATIIACGDLVHESGGGGGGGGGDDNDDDDDGY